MENILDLDFDDNKILEKIKKEKTEVDMNIISGACDIQSACDCDCACNIPDPIKFEAA